jgi:hypothetical protein
MRRAATILTIAALTAGCGLAPPSPSDSATPTPAEASAASDASVDTFPSPAGSADATPRPGPDTVPRFAAGSLAVTNAPGLRLRPRPGTNQGVLTTLGLDADLLVVLGPIMVADLGWYLVRDADDADPEFSEGWVAAGFEPDPFLISGGTTPADNPVLGGFADTAAGEYGPVAIPDRQVTVRWIAATYQRDVCNFALDLSTGSGDPVRAVRTPVGAFPASGELPSQFFVSNPGLVDSIFALVESDCSWAIAFVREPAAQSPAPS